MNISAWLQWVDTMKGRVQGPGVSDLQLLGLISLSNLAVLSISIYQLIVAGLDTNSRDTRHACTRHEFSMPFIPRAEMAWPLQFDAN